MLIPKKEQLVKIIKREKKDLTLAPAVKIDNGTEGASTGHHEPNGSCTNRKFKEKQRKMKHSDSEEL